MGKDVSGANHIVQNSLNGQMPGYPNMFVPIVDVRDVAAAHVAAMTASGAAGQRFLVGTGEPAIAMSEIGATLRRDLGANASQVPTRTIPNLIVKATALFTVVYGITQDLGLAVALAVGAGAAVTVSRIVRRTAPWRALAALAFVLVGALLALGTGEASGFFASQILFGLTASALNAVLSALRLPPAGLIVGLATNEGLRWRRCALRVRGYVAASLVFLTAQVLSTATSLFFYLTDNIVGLGIVDMANAVVFSAAVLIGWRAYRHIVGDHVCDGETRCGGREALRGRG